MNDYIFDEVLIHYGIPRRSGRYPWGSGENPYQHEDDFLSRVNELKTQGLSETEIAKYLGMSTTEYRAEKAVAKAARRQDEIARIISLREDGKTYEEIAQILGKPGESSVRALLNERAEERMKTATNVADFLKKQVDEKGLIDVGAGVELELNISKEKLKQALIILEKEGYVQYNRSVEQATNPGKQTHLMVLCPPGTEHKDIYEQEIHSLKDYISHDDGETFDPKWVYPESMDSSRLMVRYADEGGKEKDGVIELRRGVDDLDLNGSHYAQVRILVDGTHYLKGMAVYSDDMPDGVDIIFNTNKTEGTPALGEKNNTVLKLIDTKDPNNPFGSLIKEGIDEPGEANVGGQHYYIDKDGNKKLSLINKRSDEGDWGEWADKLPSQFLSKQRQELINKQLNNSIADKQAEFEDIMSLENPTVKRQLLYSFAEDCDAASIHLKAAALPRQKYQVILPITSMKDDEVYAPNYKDGETVALVRYPHGGIFEIPILKVNNKNAEGKEIISSTGKDAIGINSKVASQLSGADFDGDTVMVIPCNSATSNIRISSKPALKGLADFDPKVEYGGKPEGTFKVMKNTQNEMGKISNLITDMTLKGATDEELTRAVKHSMVVIDAEKHHLDYKLSETVNDIKGLQKKYQRKVDDDGNEHTGGASTLISRAKSPVDVLKRKGSAKINPDTGELEYKSVVENYIDPKTGKERTRTTRITAMENTKDAYTLSSGTPQENAYAKYANKLKSMANQARVLYSNTQKLTYNRQAAKLYSKEVESLDHKLSLAQLNAPRERMAQLMANNYISSVVKSNPGMSKSEIKKLKQRAISRARTQVAAKRTPISITDKEWKAIQSGAISDTKLSQILKYTDTDKVKALATPYKNKGLSPSKLERLHSLAKQGYTNEQIANALGISPSTVSKNLNS